MENRLLTESELELVLPALSNQIKSTEAALLNPNLPESYKRYAAKSLNDLRALMETLDQIYQAM